MPYRPDITGQHIVSDSGDVVLIYEIATAERIAVEFRALKPSPCHAINQARERLAGEIEAALASAADLRARFNRAA